MEKARGQFDEAMPVKLRFLIRTINTWGRIAIGFRMQHPTKATKAAFS
jgi:hypothetical protein